MRILIFGLLSVLSFAASAESDYKMARVFKVKELSIRTEDGKEISCSDENKDFDDETRDKNKGIHFLVPSFQPRQQRASWPAENCSSMHPDYNVFGFSSIHINTGEATVYVANAVSIDNPNVEKPGPYATPNENLAYNLEQGMYPRHSRLSNVQEFKAKCTYSIPSYVGSYYYDNEYNCELADNRGHVKLIFTEIENYEIPRGLINDIIDRRFTGYLEGQRAEDAD